MTKKYGTVVIVYNGYNGDPITKDATHLRSTGYCAGVTVHFARGMMIKSKKDELFSSKANSQQFTPYLSGNVDRAECILDKYNIMAGMSVFLRGWLPHRGKAQMACNYCFPTKTMF